MNARLAILAVLVAGGVATIAGALGLSACDDAKSHVYAARAFEPDRNCLDDYGAVDVVSGGDVSSKCGAVCLTNAGTTYLSTVCPPYPPLFGVELADAAIGDTCAAALAAQARGDICVPDGGSTHPVDGGADGGDGGGAADDGGDAANGDAGVDALADAASD